MHTGLVRLGGEHFVVLTTWNWQAAGRGAQPALSVWLARLAQGGWWRGHAHISDLVKTVPQTVPPAFWGAAGLLGDELLRAAEAAAQQLAHGLPHVAAAQSVDNGVQARVEHSQHDAQISAEQQRALPGRTEEIHQKQHKQGPPADQEDCHDSDHSF